MTKIRIEKKHSYTIMAQLPLRDYRLSLKAKGLLAFFISLPDTWIYTIEGLAKVLKEGPDAISTALHELEKYGYLVRQRLRTEKGRLADTEYVISEIPQVIPDDLRQWAPQDSGGPTFESPEQERPKRENPAQDYPMQKNRTQRNIDKSSKERKKTSINQSIQDIKDEVMEAIDYEALLEDIDSKWLDNIVSIISSVLHSTKPYTKIGGEDYLTEEVQRQFRKLNAAHIRYVREMMDATASDIQNIRAYLLTALYNAVDTMETHYHAKAKHDLAYGDYSSRCLDLLGESE